MKQWIRVILSALAFFGLMTVLAIFFFWPRGHLEVEVCETKKSPDGRWTAVVQMEVYSIGFVTDAVYAVRLKGRAQKDREGDLVMNIPVNYPDPEPSVDWSDGKLVVTLSKNEKYQYLANPVSGVPIGRGGAPFPCELTQTWGAAPFPFRGGCVPRMPRVTISEQQRGEELVGSRR
jgi:hypothetical protein